MNLTVRYLFEVLPRRSVNDFRPAEHLTVSCSCHLNLTVRQDANEPDHVRVCSCLLYLLRVIDLSSSWIRCNVIQRCLHGENYSRYPTYFDTILTVGTAFETRNKRFMMTYTTPSSRRVLPPTELHCIV